MSENKNIEVREGAPATEQTKYPGTISLLSQTPPPRGINIDVGSVKWYRSTYYNATILGLCSFAGPGLWGAMNSLGERHLFCLSNSDNGSN